MSKKMMKRSLALGALMAFVITGQVFAETLSGEIIGNGGDKIYTDGSAYATVMDTVTIKGYDNLTIESTSGNAIGNPAPNNSTINIEANNINLKANESYEGDGTHNGNAIQAYGDNHNALKAVVNVTATGDLTLLANNRIIRATGKMNTAGPTIYNEAEVSIAANNIYMNSNADGTVTNDLVDDAAIKVDKTAKVTITAENNLFLNATGKMNPRAIYVGGHQQYDGATGELWPTPSVVMKANNAVINGGIKVQENAEFSFEGNQFKVTGEDICKSDNSYLVHAHAGGAKINIDSDVINITNHGKVETKHAVYSSMGANINFKDFNELNIHNYDETGIDGEGGCGVIASNGAINITGKEGSIVNIYADNRAAVASLGSEINITNIGDLKLTSTFDSSNSSSYKKAVLSAAKYNDTIGGKNVQITTDKLTITNVSDIAETYAIYVTDNGSVMNINAGTANIKGAIKVDGGTLNMTNIGKLVLQGLKPDSDAAIKVNGGILQVNADGKEALAIEGAEAGNTYNVVSGVGEETALWTDDSLAYDRTTMVATSNHDKNKKLYTVKYESFNDVSEVTPEIKDQFVAAVGGKEELAVPMLVAASTGQGTVMEETAPGAKKFLAAVSSDAEMPKETKAAVINSAAKLAEAGGNAGTAASVANNVSSVTTGRMSFSGGSQQGGHGVGLFEEGSGAAVWAQYMHGKDEATNMPMDGGATSYESDYDGIVVGVDFKKVGKFQSGVAFNYGEGDSNGFGSGIKTSSEYDFWGVGYYGNIRNEDTNFIFDVNYAKSDSDVTQNNPAGTIEASPETTTWSAGVKVEKLYQNESVQIVPYTGLRYMSIDTEEYQSNVAGKALFNYAPERQDIWLLPLGLTIKQEVVNDNGWVVTPKVDLSYIWAFGDTDSNMSVSIPGIAASNDTLGFTVMDDGSFLGLVGVEAKLDDWTFGVSYSYQKGDYAESKKWFVDAKYSF